MRFRRDGRKIFVVVILLLVIGCRGDGVDQGSTSRADPPAGPVDSIEAEGDAVKVVVLGASFVESWSLPRSERVLYLNRGVGGETSYEMASRFDEDVLAEDPDVVVIWAGINDLFRADKDAVDDARESATETIRSMVRRARDSGVVPAISTEVPICCPRQLKDRAMRALLRLRGKEDYAARINRNVHALNEWIRAYGTAEGVWVIDFGGILTDASGGRRTATAAADGAHISPAGYELLTRRLEDEMSRVLSGASHDEVRETSPDSSY